MMKEILFENYEDFKEHLQELKRTDVWKSGRISTCKTTFEDNKGYIEVEGDKYPLSPLAIHTLEERSGDTARGHMMMNMEQILGSMNNYWPLHAEEAVGQYLVRDGEFLAFHSEQYLILPQIDLLETIESQFEDEILYKKGIFSNEMTLMSFEMHKRINETFKAAWKKASLPVDVLDESNIVLTFVTNDVGTQKAKIFATMNVDGVSILLGDPIEVKHRKGAGTLEAFKRDLLYVDMNIDEELSYLSVLMNTTIENPQNCLIKAMKKAKLDEASKKACKELTEYFLYEEETSAYLIYLYLNTLMDTSFVKGFSADRRLRISCSIRRLIKENWKKFDVPGLVEL